MYCRMCGKPVQPQTAACPACGCAPLNPGGHFCWNCAAETNPAAVACVKCGAALSPPAPAIPGFGPGLKSRTTAALLNLIPLVGLPGGIGRLYLGYTNIGVAQLLLSFVCVGHIWSIIDGIIILTGNPPTDSNGQPLTN